MLTEKEQLARALELLDSCQKLLKVKGSLLEAMNKLCNALLERARDLDQTVDVRNDKITGLLAEIEELKRA